MDKYTMDLSSLKEEQDYILCKKMHATGDNHVNQIKVVSKKQTSYMDVKLREQRGLINEGQKGEPSE